MSGGRTTHQLSWLPLTGKGQASVHRLPQSELSTVWGEGTLVRCLRQPVVTELSYFIVTLTSPSPLLSSDQVWNVVVSDSKSDVISLEISQLHNQEFGPVFTLSLLNIVFVWVDIYVM